MPEIIKFHCVYSPERRAFVFSALDQTFLMTPKEMEELVEEGRRNLKPGTKLFVLNFGQEREMRFEDSDLNQLKLLMDYLEKVWESWKRYGPKDVDDGPHRHFNPNWN